MVIEARSAIPGAGLCVAAAPRGTIAPNATIRRARRRNGLIGSRSDPGRMRVPPAAVVVTDQPMARTGAAPTPLTSMATNASARRTYGGSPTLADGASCATAIAFSPGRSRFDGK